MQKCCTCNIGLNEETGYIKSKDRYQSRCKKCFSRYCAERWTKRKHQAIEYKGGSCELCGYNKYHGALEFHHLDPSEKDVEWTRLRLRNWEKIKIELNKCILLCANCHREEHQRIGSRSSAGQEQRFSTPQVGGSSPSGSSNKLNS